jgi:hypothetical protein
VLVGASLVQGAAQAATAAIVLAGVATVPLLAVLGVLWGVGDGLVVPAEAGLVPQTVSPARLQQATHCRACRAAACGSSARRWAASSSSR